MVPSPTTAPRLVGAYSSSDSVSLSMYPFDADAEGDGRMERMSLLEIRMRLLPDRERKM